MSTGGPAADPYPTELKLRKRSHQLQLLFSDGARFELSAEYLRVHSPSAEVKGHGAGERLLVLDFGKVIGIGDPDEIMNRADVKEIYLGIEV